MAWKVVSVRAVQRWLDRQPPYDPDVMDDTVDMEAAIERLRSDGPNAICDQFTFLDEDDVALMNGEVRRILGTPYREMPPGPLGGERFRRTYLTVRISGDEDAVEVEDVQTHEMTT